MAINTHGSELRVGDGGVAQVFTPVGKVRGLNLPALSRQEFNVTTHEDGATRRLRGEVLDGGPVKCEVLFDPDDPTHDQTTGLLSMLAEVGSVAVKDWQVAGPVEMGLRYAFSGWLKIIGEVALAVDGELVLPVEIAVDGDVVIEADS